MKQFTKQIFSFLRDIIQSIEQSGMRTAYFWKSKLGVENIAIHLSSVIAIEGRHSYKQLI